MKDIPINYSEHASLNGYHYLRVMTENGWEYAHWSGIEKRWVKFDPSQNQAVVAEFEKPCQ